jgi:hypothetical protein
METGGLGTGFWRFGFGSYADGEGDNGQPKINNKQSS